MKKTILSILMLTTFGVFAQNVNIPDANFKAYLVGNSAININGDTEIQVSEANNFTGAITCDGSSITDLMGIEAFTSLTELDCSSNSLLSLDVSSNTFLTELECGSTSISTLDVSSNTALTALYCTDNALSSLNLSSNTALAVLNCSNNSINSLDLTSNTNLAVVICNWNSLNTLDVSMNTSLTALECKFNSLNSLNIANGNNPNLIYFYAENNPQLTCIEVDDPVLAAGYSIWSIDAIANYSVNCGIPPCIVTIPDANFKAYLVGNASINTNGDTEIQCSEASSFTGMIDCNNLSIADLTGIEAFTSLTELNCANNDLVSLDLSQNTDLTLVYCFYNLLSTFDIGQNTMLATLSAGDNALTNLDLSNNTALEFLNLNNNSFTSLDISNNSMLTLLQVNGNQLTSLDVTQNTLLTSLWLSTNSISSIDLTQNSSLETLVFSGNQMSSVDLSSNSQLNYLDCGYNNLVSLDISGNVLINYLICGNNTLSNLNVANGNNSNFLWFNATGNPDLTCIQVDEAVWSTTNWTNIDVTASFSEDCFLSVEENTISFNISPNPTNGIIEIKSDQEIESISVLSAVGKEVLTTKQPSFDLSNLTNGVYFVTVNANGILSTQKLIKK